MYMSSTVAAPNDPDNLNPIQWVTTYGGKIIARPTLCINATSKILVEHGEYCDVAKAHDVFHRMVPDHRLELVDLSGLDHNFQVRVMNKITAELDKDFMMRLVQNVHRLSDFCRIEFSIKY